MNAWQTIDRVASVLDARLWGGYIGEAGVGEKVFGSVIASVNETRAQLAGLRLPAALVFPGTGDHDDDEPRLMTRDIIVAVIVAGSGDMAGRGVLMGHSRASATSSSGAGLLQIEGEVYDALHTLNEKESIRIWAVAESAPQPDYVEELYILSGAYGFKARMTTFLERQQVGSFTVSGDPTVTLTWTAPPSTTDLVEYRVRRVSGSVPTPFVTGGTAVTLGGALDLTVNDTPGAGTYTYSVFAGYDSEGGATGFRWSNHRWTTHEVTS